ncbi:DeoR/GlpR family DNA-binding transcription regulator [Leucobacter soli]|uniref:DeoR/GlpR family DNA-binding transcription regulator n=1 Tax=Leucobacter soli TaxID=2812850 RepID=UPI0036219DF7
MRLFPRSGAVALDASSTIGTLAGRMRGAWSVTVATNSYENFTALAAIPKVTPVLAGGELEPSTGSLVGPITCAAAESLVYQRFFLSASAVDAVHGTSEVSLAEAEVKRAFAGRSRETVLCVDSTKLGQLSSAAGFPLSAIDVMITELAPSDPRLDPYRGLVELV